MARKSLGSRSTSADVEHDWLRVETLYRLYAGWLVAALRRRFGSAVSDSAEDIVHDVCLRIAPVKMVTGVRHPKALLMTVAANLARDRIRKAGRGGSTALAVSDDRLALELQAQAGLEEGVLLKQVVLDLAPPLRDVFLLSRFADMTNQEIARHLGLSVKTVEWRMAKALHFISAKLAQ